MNHLLERLNSEVRGQDGAIELSLAAMLAGGHLLLEGPPGVGKTRLAKSMATAVSGTFSRIQMTSDLLPSELTGTLRLHPQTRELEFKPGPLFANVVLCDELNRTSPKTQGALLEAMEEKTVSIDGHTHRLPSPFFVIATQNPLESHGVYPLAESQLDRFMLQLAIGHPAAGEELLIYRSPEFQTAPKSGPSPVCGIDTLVQMQESARGIFVEESLTAYALALVRETRAHPQVSNGVSVRGGLQWLAASRALAFVRGREFVVPKDLIDTAVPALAHRLQLSDGSMETAAKSQVISEILKKIPAPQ